MTLGRILWVTAEPPDHEVGGGAIRQAHLLAGLGRAGAELHLLVAGPVTDPVVRAGAAMVREVSVPAHRAAGSVTARRLRDVWRVAGARIPAEMADRRRERAALGRELRDGHASPSAVPGPSFAVVHVEHLGLAGIVPPGLASLRSLGVQNVPSRMAEQARDLAPGPRQRLLLGAEAAAARRFQRLALNATDVVAVVSDDDSRALLPGPGRSAGAGPVVLVVPNGVDPRRFPVTGLPDAPRIVFTGTLDYLPNVDGVVWFAREVLPIVRRQVPDAELAVVGRRPVAEVRALSALPGVAVHADVPAVGPFLDAARVAVVPVRIGTGSRVKALEAMAGGRPVAGTTIGLEGLDVQVGRDALVGDTPEDLAAAVVRLIGEPKLASRTAAAGRTLVERTYDWARIADRYAAELSVLVDQATAGPSGPAA